MQDGEHATVGSRVTIFQAENQRRSTYTLLGPWDADQAKGVLSYLSPLGSAILGKRVGDEFKLDVAAGPASYRLEAIENGLQATTQSEA